MIKTYYQQEKGLEKVFFVLKDGKVTSVVVGNKAVSHEAGIQFYVEDYVAEQLHKCELYIDGFTPKLKLKDGEKLFVSEESEAYKKQKKIEELEKRLKKLKAK